MSLLEALQRSLKGNQNPPIASPKRFRSPPLAAGLPPLDRGLWGNIRKAQIPGVYFENHDLRLGRYGEAVATQKHSTTNLLSQEYQQCLKDRLWWMTMTAPKYQSVDTVKPSMHSYPIHESVETASDDGIAPGARVSPSQVEHFPAQRSVFGSPPPDPEFGDKVCKAYASSLFYDGLRIQQYQVMENGDAIARGSRRGFTPKSFREAYIKMTDEEIRVWELGGEEDGTEQDDDAQSISPDSNDGQFTTLDLAGDHGYFNHLGMLPDEGGNRAALGDLAQMAPASSLSPGNNVGQTHEEVLAGDAARFGRHSHATDETTAEEYKREATSQWVSGVYEETQPSHVLKSITVPSQYNSLRESIPEEQEHDTSSTGTNVHHGLPSITMPSPDQEMANTQAFSAIDTTPHLSRPSQIKEPQLEAMDKNSFFAAIKPGRPVRACRLRASREQLVRGEWASTRSSQLSVNNKTSKPKRQGSLSTLSQTRDIDDNGTEEITPSVLKSVKGSKVAKANSSRKRTVARGKAGPSKASNTNMAVQKPPGKPRPDNSTKAASKRGKDTTAKKKSTNKTKRASTKEAHVLQYLPDGRPVRRSTRVSKKPERYSPY